MKKLETLSLSRLTVLEFGQHVKSVCESLTENCNITDEVLLDYLDTQNTKLINYDKAVLQIAKSDETIKIAAADKERDAAITAALRMLNVYELSNNSAEQEAFTSLTTLFNTYKGIQTWNFEEETSGLDNLNDDLMGTKYSPHVTTLKMGSCVLRIKTVNDNFKTLFAGRTHETATKEVFDVKTMRTEMKIVYEDMVNYVLAMAKVLNTDEFNASLSHINAVRKYYADMLARRNSNSTTETPVV